MAGMKNTVSILFMNRLKQLGLLDIWLWVADNNPSGRVNYHNNYHNDIHYNHHGTAHHK